MPGHTPKEKKKKNKIKVTQGKMKKRKPSTKPRKMTKKIKLHDI